MKNISFIALLFVAIFSVSAHASNESHRKAAEDLLDVTNARHTLDVTIQRMISLQIRQQPQMAPFRDVMVKFFNKYMSFDSLKNDYIQIYTEEFSEQELRDIIAFYKTPTGQKTIKRLPSIMQKGSQVGMSKVRMHIEEFKAMIEEESKRLKAGQEKNKNKGPNPPGNLNVK